MVLELLIKATQVELVQTAIAVAVAVVLAQ
jgi:hypothetical protein